MKRRAKKLRVKLFGAALAVMLGCSGSLIAAQAWAGQADRLDSALNLKRKMAKNVIVMISDGCGYNQIAATDYFQNGKSGSQAYERFPVKLGMSTYEMENVGGQYQLLGYDPRLAWSDFNYVKNNTTDSASAATAMSTGVKTYGGAIGVDTQGQPLKHIAERAEELGKATGVVTTVEFSHATPAGFVAHNLSRNNYAAIAQEMIMSSATDVIMGAGNPGFNDDGQPRTSDPKYVGGQATWDALRTGSAGLAVDADHNGKLDDAWKLAQTKADIQALAEGPTPKRVCAVPQVYTTLQQARSGNPQAAPYVVPLNQNVPTLAEMSRAALNVLDDDEDGVFLMIEGGAIDWASHANQSGRLIEEEIDFNQAVEAVIQWVQKNSNWAETLLIVTGDHETGYLTGPGSDPAWQPIVNNGTGNVPGMEWHSTDHTNSLIPLFAKGLASYLMYCYADQKDPVRGRYIDNIEIAKTLVYLLR